MRRLLKRVNERKDRFKKTKFREEEMYDMMINICNPQEEQGEWITEYDLVEDGDKLLVKRQSSPGLLNFQNLPISHH